MLPHRIAKLVKLLLQPSRLTCAASAGVASRCSAEAGGAQRKWVQGEEDGTVEAAALCACLARRVAALAAAVLRAASSERRGSDEQRAATQGRGARLEVCPTLVHIAALPCVARLFPPLT